MKPEVVRRSTPEVFLAGIDGSGKSTVLHLLISRLEGDYKILSIQDELVLHDKGKKTRVLEYSCFKTVHRLKTSDNRHIRRLVLPFTFALRHLESSYLKRNSAVDLMLYETDSLLHPGAFSAFHFPWVRKFSSVMRFRVLRALFRRRENFLTFYLDTEARTAIERIRERQMPTDEHENLTDLQALKVEFDRMVQAAADSNMEVVRINTNNRTVESVVGEIEGILRGKLALSCETAIQVGST